MMCPNGFNGIYQKRDSSEYMLLWHDIKNSVMLSYGHKLMVVSFDVLTLKISRHASTHADPKRLIRTDKWKCAGGYKSGFRRRKVHQILSSSKPSKTMMFRTVIPLLLLLIPLLGCAEAMNENIRACGPNLMEVMIMMCPNGFNGIYQKRDSSEYMLLWFSERHEITRFLVLPYHFQ